MAERGGVTAEGCCWARFPPLTLPRLLPHHVDDHDDDDDDDGGDYILQLVTSSWIIDVNNKSSIKVQRMWLINTDINTNTNTTHGQDLTEIFLEQREEYMCAQIETLQNSRNLIWCIFVRIQRWAEHRHHHHQHHHHHHHHQVKALWAIFRASTALWHHNYIIGAKWSGS